jgi:hypothetical protein
MLRNYATFLGLEADRVLDLYETSQRDATRQRRSQRTTEEVLSAPRKITDTPPAMPAVTFNDRRGSGESIRNILVALVITLVSIGAIGVIVYVVIEFIRTPDDTNIIANAPTQDPLLATLLPTQTYTATWTPRPTEPTPTIPFTGALVGDSLNVEVNPTQRLWLRVLSDGTEIYAGILRPEEVVTFSAVSRMDITASNAAGLNLVFNGQQQSNFGLHGQQVALIFTAQGMEVQRDEALFAPTPIESSTPLPTPTDIASNVILALTPTATEGPSPTPSNTFVPTETFTPTITLTPIPTLTSTPTTTLTNTPTLTPTLTLIPTETFTPTLIPTETLSPTPTAILPPRVTPTPAQTQKAP